MVRNILLMKLTEQGAKDIKGAPARIENALKGFEQIGGKLLGIYAVTGEYDYIAIGELPSDEAGVIFSFAGLLVQAFHIGIACLQDVVRGLHARYYFHPFHHRHRVHEVYTDDLLRLLGGSGN